MASTTPPSAAASSARAPGARAGRRRSRPRAARAGGQRLERRGRQRARVAVRGTTSARGVRQQLAQHRGGVLVVEDRDDRGERPAVRDTPAATLVERGDPARVVRAVEHVSGSSPTIWKRPGTSVARRPRAHRLGVQLAEVGLRGRRAPARSCARWKSPRRAERHAGVGAARTSLAPARAAAASASRSASGCSPRRRPASRPAAARRASRARCRSTVGPSQRVCSSPTFVSTCTPRRRARWSRPSARRGPPR